MFTRSSCCHGNAEFKASSPSAVRIGESDNTMKAGVFPSRRGSLGPTDDGKEVAVRTLTIPVMLVLSSTALMGNVNHGELENRILVLTR